MEGQRLLGQLLSSSLVGSKDGFPSSASFASNPPCSVYWSDVDVYASPSVTRLSTIQMVIMIDWMNMCPVTSLIYQVLEKM